MVSKVRAAKMASLSGVRAVIANASRTDVLVDAVSGVSVGTEVAAQDRAITARKLWIGFAVESEGRIVVDDGARNALLHRGVSLLPAGVVSVVGEFEEGAAVDVLGVDGQVIGRGLCRFGSADAKQATGKRSSELPDDAPSVLVHRDDLVLF
jgi:glutamate 5-kinase